MEEKIENDECREFGLVNSTIQTICNKIIKNLRKGSDKSLTRPTSRCRRTESIVSLERGACSCAELQVFSCYRGWKEARQATRAISTTRETRAVIKFFFFLQGKVPKEIYAILIEPLAEHSPSYATVKNRVAQFKRGDFSTYDAPHPGRSKTVTTPEIIDQIHELILEDRRTSAKSMAEQLGISRERLNIRIKNRTISKAWTKRRRWETA